MVRDAAPLGDRQLGRADVHPAVELGGVGAHHLAGQGLSEVEREVRLAGGRGTDHGDDQGAVRDLPRVVRSGARRGPRPGRLHP